MRKQITNLPDIECDIEFGDTIKIDAKLDDTQSVQIIKDTPKNPHETLCPGGAKYDSFGVPIVNNCVEKVVFSGILKLARDLMPWRNGPFRLFGTLIDTEWRSYIKLNLLLPHIDLKDKVIADVGCNNGYYMFRMLPYGPKSITGFDPSGIYYTQFEFLNHFIKSDIRFELLGVEELGSYGKKFDVIFCLGVIYHRSDPIGALKSLFGALNSGGELILDSIVIDGEDEMCLCPRDAYAKMKNVYFLPTVKTLTNWLFWTGFKEIELLGVIKTTTDEQRLTDWIYGQSLESFVDFTIDKTIEGYDAPKRAYIKAKKDG